MTLAEAARATGVPKPSAFRHLRALARAGVLEVHGQTPRARRYSLTPAGLRNLQAVPFPLKPALANADPPGEPAPGTT